jgi:DNA-binding transcriptional LysR family regulator
VALGVPKSTVSRRVADLEAQLGLQLLRRTTRTVALTEPGEAFFREASLALSTLGEAVRAVKDTQAAPSGTLRVTAPATFAEFYLGEVLVGFARDFPAVQLAVDLTDRNVDLVGEGYDVAFRAGVLPDSSLKARLLGETPVVCVASPGYAKRRGLPKTPEALADHDVVAFTRDDFGAVVRWSFVVRKKKVSVTVRPRFAVNSYVLLRQLATAGLGVTRVPLGLVSEALAHGRLVRCLDEFLGPPSPMNVLYVGGQHQAPKVRAFLDYLSSHLRDTPWDRAR